MPTNYFMILLVLSIIVSKTSYWKRGCLVKVVGDPITDSKPLFTSIGKLVHGMRDYPTVLHGLRGYVKVSCTGSSEEQLKRRINCFLQTEFMGTKTAEGFGRVKWESCEIRDYTPKTPITIADLLENCPQCQSETVIYDKFAKQKLCTTCKQTWFFKKFKLRKGIRADYPEELQKLLIALMLHDFVHTEKHPSKIFQEVTITNEAIRDACKHHHNSLPTENTYHLLIQYYDGLASYITRKKPCQTTFRYKKSEGEIDFQKLKEEIETNQVNHLKLYNYIFNSNVLKRIVESLHFGNNTLRNHLLVMVNLAINDYYDGKLKISKGKISLSASKRGELVTAMDAETHSFPNHDTANSERATTSKKRRLEA